MTPKRGQRWYRELWSDPRSVTVTMIRSGNVYYTSPGGRWRMSIDMFKRCFRHETHVSADELATANAERRSLTPRKPYAKPTVTRQPFEHLIDLECRANPNM